MLPNKLGSFQDWWNWHQSCATGRGRNLGWKSVLLYDKVSPNFAIYNKIVVHGLWGSATQGQLSWVFWLLRLPSGCQLGLPAHESWTETVRRAQAHSRGCQQKASIPLLILWLDLGGTCSQFCCMILVKQTNFSMMWKGTTQHANIRKWDCGRPSRGWLCSWFIHL